MRTVHKYYKLLVFFVDDVIDFLYFKRSSSVILRLRTIAATFRLIGVCYYSCVVFVQRYNSRMQCIWSEGAWSFDADVIAK